MKEITEKELQALDHMIAQQGLIMRSNKHDTQAGVDYESLKNLREKVKVNKGTSK